MLIVVLLSKAQAVLPTGTRTALRRRSTFRIHPCPESRISYHTYSSASSNGIQRYKAVQDTYVRRFNRVENEHSEVP